MGWPGNCAWRGRGESRRVFPAHAFSPPDIFLKLPWRVEVLDELLDYDVLGFQTPRDRDNFAGVSIICCRRCGGGGGGG